MSKNTKLAEVLKGYKVGELKELAKVSGISGYSKLKKAELLEVVSERLTTMDITVLAIPDELKAIISDSANIDEAADSPAEDNKEKTTITRSSAPIIGVAPHVMNVRQDGQMPFTQLNQNIGSIRKIYPNEPCPCGSGKKYKKCCGRL